jgi:hypothetical protein
LPGSAAFVSESCCLSEGCVQRNRLGAAGRPQIVPPAAGELAAQRDDVSGPVLPDCFARRVTVIALMAPCPAMASITAPILRAAFLPDPAGDGPTVEFCGHSGQRDCAMAHALPPHSCVSAGRGLRGLQGQGAGDQDRTGDLPFTRRLLCQLSYTGADSEHGSRNVP